MTTQNYCMINEATGICENLCLWDGNLDTWTPPAGYVMLLQATTPAKMWAYSADSYSLVAQDGAGQIGFTWDGTHLITNDPMPTELVQPTTTGSQTL